MDRYEKFMVVFLALMAWIPNGAQTFAVEPGGSMLQLVGSILGVWLAASCVLKISAWWKTRRAKDDN